MKVFRFILMMALMLGITSLVFSQGKPDWEGGVPEGCTSITVGKDASVDGSVMTSHTDDSHRTRSWMDIQHAKDHKEAATVPMYKRVTNDSLAMPAYAHLEIGSIPQVEHTYQYINTAYPSMNEHQLAIGESTFGGRDALQSDEGLIDCQRLAMLMLQRTTTAREAIKMAGELTSKYGWNDAGEALTIADTEEVWHFEIVGPGKGKTGASWVAQRVPDGHISCNANASTIKEIDLDNEDYFMASDNIYDMALDSGWTEDKASFRFCDAYAPESRNSLAARRREWRIFDLMAPSKGFDPNAQNYPFSVKPDEKVTKEKMVEIFKDYYEGTPYDMTRNITTTDEDGNEVISPLANPFLPYDELKIQNVNGGWYHVDDKTGDIRFLGERTIARWYTMYATITQSRSWLPDEVGGVVWLAQDNVATSIYIPVYSNITHLPPSYEEPGRKNGYTLESAWWVFNRLGTLTAQRWGDMRHDVDEAWVPMQKELFENQDDFEKEVLELLENGEKEKAVKKMTDYTNKWGNKVVNEAIDLADYLWTKYDEKF